MITAKIETTVENDGELRLTQLPCRKGDRVEAILFIHRDQVSEAEDEREEARKRFLARAKSSTFRSGGPYPSRDKLHERH